MNGKGQGEGQGPMAAITVKVLLTDGREVMATQHANGAITTEDGGSLSPQQIDKVLTPLNG